MGCTARVAELPEPPQISAFPQYGSFLWFTSLSRVGHCEERDVMSLLQAVFQGTRPLLSSNCAIPWVPCILLTDKGEET